jgi:biopolymer transport protein ExbD
MKYVLEVCLIALVAGSFASSSAAQSSAMQPGISVELVPTRNASPVPDADGEDAFIVTVTANSSIYLGVKPITLPQLMEKTRSTPFRRGRALYIKADGQTPYVAVLRVLEATDSRGMIPQVLLTNQSNSLGSGAIQSPEGLDISVGSTVSGGKIATAVQLSPSVEERPLLRINGDETSWSALESTLRSHFQNGDDKTVLLRADPRLPFADVVHAVDGCRAAGAKVYLAAPGNKL